MIIYTQISTTRAGQPKFCRPTNDDIIMASIKTRTFQIIRRVTNPTNNKFAVVPSTFTVQDAFAAVLDEPFQYLLWI